MASKTNYNKVLLERRKRRVRKRISGTTEQPRLRVSRSTKHIYAQIIDDTTGTTMAAASSLALASASSALAIRRLPSEASFG